MITTFAPKTTYMPHIEMNPVVMKQLPLIDTLGGITYLASQSMFSENRTLSQSGFYFEFRKNTTFTNHIELYGKEAVRFDEVVSSITEPNESMSELIKDVYEDRIFD